MITSVQEEITRLIRDNERFIAEYRQQAKEGSHHREALERLQGDQGIECAYIGGSRNDIEVVAKALALPPQVYPAFGLCVGYQSPDRPAKVKPRLPQQIVLHHETYSAAAVERVLADYDERLGAFYQREGMHFQFTFQ